MLKCLNAKTTGSIFLNYIIYYKMKYFDEYLYVRLHSNIVT